MVFLADRNFVTDMAQHDIEPHEHHTADILYI